MCLSQSESCTLRPIPYIEADFSKADRLQIDQMCHKSLISCLVIIMQQFGKSINWNVSLPRIQNRGTQWPQNVSDQNIKKNSSPNKNIYYGTMFGQVEFHPGE